MRQRRRPHRYGKLTKGAQARLRKEITEREQAAHEQERQREQEGETNVAEIMIPQTEGGGNFRDLPPGMYAASVSNIEEVNNPFEEDKTQLQLTFTIDGENNDDGTPCEKRAWANPVFNPQSKLYKWVSAISGVPAAGEPFRTSTLVGKPCRIFMNTAKKADGTEFTKIVDVLSAEVNIPKKPGLVAALKEEGCSVKNCKRELFVYDSDGLGFCEKHAPDDDE